MVTINIDVEGLIYIFFGLLVFAIAGVIVYSMVIQQDAEVSHDLDCYDSHNHVMQGINCSGYDVEESYVPWNIVILFASLAGVWLVMLGITTIIGGGNHD